MPRSGVEMLIVPAPSLYVHSNVPANKMFILIDIGAKGNYHFNQKAWLCGVATAGSIEAAEWMLLWAGERRHSVGGVSLCNYPSLTGIPGAAIVIFACSERKSICTDV